MSFDFFVERFVAGWPAKFPRAPVDEAFGPFVVGRDEYHWTLRYPDGGGAFCGVKDSPEITGFTLNRPGGVAVYNSVFEVLRRTPTVAHWGSGCATADPSIIPDLPPEMIEALGAPLIVKSGQELFDYVTRPMSLHENAS